MISLAKVKEAAAAFLGEKWQIPVEVAHVEKIFGGASRETYLLNLKAGGAARDVILRRDPPSSLIDTERQLEFGAYERIFPTDVPVPEPLFLEYDSSWLGQPFSIMAAIPDCQSDVSMLAAEQKQKLGRQKYQILGRLAKKDPVALGFDAITDMPAAEDCALRQLQYWESVIREDELHPQPIAWAAIRWLHRNLPPAAQQISVVHGDYRTGNFLFNSDAEITAILDWEMCHLGDPLEDLAWSMDPLWSRDEPGLAGRLIAIEDAIAVWESESGLACDRNAFQWWRIFVALKALAIWISSSEDFHAGESKDSILAMAGWVMTDRQNRILLDYLAPDSAMQEGAA